MRTRSHVLIWLGVTLAIGLTLYVLKGVLLPFAAGMAVAFLLDPIADRLESWGLSRIVATIIITAVFFLILVLGILMLLPVIEGQIVSLANKLPEYVARGREFVDSVGGGRLRTMLDAQTADGNGLFSSLQSDLLAWGTAFLKQAVSGGFALFNLLSLIFLTPVVSFYMLLEWDNLVARVDGLLPRRRADTIRRLASEINRALSGFVRGQVTVCVLLAIFYGLALSVAGLNFGLVVGIIAGLLSFIPFVGAAVGLIASMLLAVMQFWPDYLQIGGIAVIFAAGQVLEGNFLTPRLVGNKVGLHPLWVIFALLAFGTLFGFLGMLLALPLAAMAGVLVRYGITEYTASSLYLGVQGGGNGTSTDP